MELNIKTTAYYKEYYGIDDEVDKFCQKAYSFFLDKEYSSTLHIVGIVPGIVPQEIYDYGKWKEEVQFLCNKSVVSIVIRMDFNNYHNADSVKRVF